jgi:hypothetical protein
VAWLAVLPTWRIGDLHRFQTALADWRSWSDANVSFGSVAIDVAIYPQIRSYSDQHLQHLME